MKTLDLKALPTDAWRPIEPSIGRTSNRVSERELEQFSAWIILPTTPGSSTSKEIAVRLWDYSSFGFAVICNHANAEPFRIEEGELVRLKVDFGEGPLWADCQVRNTSSFRNGLRIGLARRDLTRVGSPGKQILPLAGECHRLKDDFDIRAETPNPALYGEWCALRLCGIRQGLSLEFTCSDSAMPLFVGQKLDIRLALPTSGSNEYSGKIQSLERVRGDTLRLVLSPIAVAAGAANDLAEMLTFEAGILPDTLKRLGFPTRFFRSRITFRYVENMDDYAKVLNLRRCAYVDVGKKAPETDPKDMSSTWDKNSRILCAFHEEILVASVAITFPVSDDIVLRSEQAFPEGKYPVPHPAKTQLMEVNSLCTHRDYRRGDLLQSIFEQIARIFILSDRTCIMTLVETGLLPLYLGIGFHDTGHTCEFLGRRHHLIKVARNAVTQGVGLGILHWNILYGDLMRDVLRKRMVDLSPWARMVLKTRLAFGPLAETWLSRISEKAFRKSLDEVEKG